MSQSGNGNSLSERGNHIGVTPGEIDWTGIRAAAAIVIRKAARQAARDLPQDEQERFIQRAMKRCSREKWLVKAQQDKADAVVTSPRTLSANVRTGADALAHALAERRQESVVHLSKYAVQAGKRLADSNGDLKNARAFQQLASGRAHLFPEAEPETRIQVNVLSVAAIKPLRSEDHESAESR
jgi:hypothetical protein